MAKQKYITVNDLLETSAADLNENAEIMINNGTEPMKATKVKLSTILGGVKKDIANLDGDIVAAQGDIEDLQTEVQNKAEKDFSNAAPGQDFINKSIGWGLPDWSAGIAVTSPYTAPKPGLFIATCAGTGIDAITVNGDNTGMQFNAGNSASVIVSAGDVITVSSTAHATYKFFPLKGATNA